MDTDATLRPEDRSLVTCPQCGGRTAILMKEATQGDVCCTHCTAVIGRNLLALGITPPSVQGPPSEHPTAIIANMPFGRYLLKKELGRGGMGVVWLAEDPTLGRQVAIKLLSGASAEDIARFEREARTAASLSHPNIAPVFEVGVQDGRPYLSMQYIAGRTLDQAIVERRVSARQSAEIMRDAARAVHHAHENNVIHRDLKPQNIMLQDEAGKSNRIYVLDFGLARRVGVGNSISVSGTVVGTPAFMSPEQAAGSFDLDARSDVYGLGSTLYALVTGKPPYEGPSPIDVIMKVAQTEPTAPRRIHPGLHQDLETIVQTAMAREKERRYATAAALADDLQRFLDNEPIKARPASIMYQMSRRIRKHPAWLAATLALLVAIGLAIVLLTLQSTRRQERDDTAKRAEEAFSAGQFAVALSEYKELDSHDPSAKWKARIGECEGKLEAERKAREAEQKAREAAAKKQLLRDRAAHVGERVDDAASHFEAARFDPTETWGIVAASQKELDGLLEQDADNATALLHRARILRMMHKISAARADIDRAIQLQPDLRLARIERIRIIYEESLYRFTDANFRRSEAKLIDTLKKVINEDIDAARKGAESLPPRAERDLVLFDSFFDNIAHHEGRVAALKQLRRTADEKRDPELWLWLGVLLVNQGTPAEAEAAVRKGLELRPDFPRAHFVLGTFIAQDRPAEAMAAYNEAIRLDPYDPWPRLNRGTLRSKEGDDEGAFQDYQKSAELDPEFVMAWRCIYRVAYLKRDLSTAEKAIERAVALRPDLPECFRMRAELREFKKDVEGALADLREAVKLDPRDAASRRSYSLLLGRNGRGADALEQAEIALKLAPEDPRGRYARGAAYQSLGRMKDAARELDAYIAAGGNDVDGLLVHGFVHLQLGEPEIALPSLQKAAERSPKYYDAWNCLGEALRLLGRKEEALAAFENAVKADGTRTDARIGRAMLLQELGRADEALGDIEAVLKKEPKNDVAHFLHVRWLMSEGRFKEALKECDEALLYAVKARSVLEQMKAAAEERLKDP